MALSYLINIIAIWVILTDKAFALSIAIRTRRDLMWNAFLALIPGVNVFVSIMFLIEYIPRAFPIICKAINECFELDKEL
jgi:hypothetical protein